MHSGLKRYVNDPILNTFLALLSNFEQIEDLKMKILVEDFRFFSWVTIMQEIYSIFTAVWIGIFAFQASQGYASRLQRVVSDTNPSNPLHQKGKTLKSLYKWDVIFPKNKKDVKKSNVSSKCFS